MMLVTKITRIRGTRQSVLLVCKIHELTYVELDLRSSESCRRGVSAGDSSVDEVGRECVRV